MNEFEKWFNKTGFDFDTLGIEEPVLMCIKSQLQEAWNTALENQWQPIETVPLDTEVLLAGTMDNDNDWRIKVGGKLSATGEFKIFGASWIPKYWQPLPQPPKD